MKLMRSLFVMAVVAALWGAPSSVSAAANELSFPQVSPSSGSVTTVFAFRVRYDGSFPAAAVGVSVAGLSVPMTLESGSPAAGWWSASTLLPSGAWSTSFRAVALQGPAATLAGPVVIVAGLATPSPTSSGLAPPSSGATPHSAPADGLDGATAPPAAPAPPPEEAAATATGVPSPAPAAPGPDPATGGSGAPSEGGSAATPPPGGGESGTESGDGRPGEGNGGGGGDAPAGEGAPAASSGASPALGADPIVVQPASETEEGDGRTRTDTDASEVLLIGLAGIASVALIGTLLLIAGRRRDPEPVRAIAEPSVADDAVMRRMARSGRARAAGDPIVAALGIDDEMAARRAIRRSRREPPAGPPPPERPRKR